MRSLLIVLSLFLTYLSIQANGSSDERKWILAGYKNPSISEINLYQNVIKTKFSYKLDLDLLVVRHSGWTKEKLIDRYKEVAKVYSQCEIKFDKVRIIEVDAPDGVQIFSHGSVSKSSTKQFAERTPNWPRITNIHVKTIFAPYMGVSGPDFTYGENHPLLNRQWIGLISAWEGRKNTEDEPHSYVLEIHELAHVLLNDGQHIQGNPSDVMDLSRVEKKITQDQCEKIYNHLQVKGY